MGTSISGSLYQPIQDGDLLAVQGTSWFARQILKDTRGEASHIGVFVARKFPLEDSLITEALTRVKTRCLEDSLKGVSRAWALKHLNLADLQRQKIVEIVQGFSANDYNYYDIGLQGLDAITHSRWFTQHLTFGSLKKIQICSYVGAYACEQIGLDFGGIPLDSITPQDIFNFAQKRPDIYQIEDLQQWVS